MPCHFRQFKGPFRSPATLPLPARPSAGSRYSVPHRAPCQRPPLMLRPHPVAPSKRGQSTERAEDDPHPLARPSLPRLLNIVSLRTLLHRPPAVLLPSLPFSPFSPRVSLFLSLVSRCSNVPRRRRWLLTSPPFPYASRRSYHGDETRTPTNFYCYFSRRFL